MGNVKRRFFVRVSFLHRRDHFFELFFGNDGFQPGFADFHKLSPLPDEGLCSRERPESSNPERIKSAVVIFRADLSRSRLADSVPHFLEMRFGHKSNQFVIFIHDYLLILHDTIHGDKRHFDSSQCKHF